MVNFALKNNGLVIEDGGIVVFEGKVNNLSIIDLFQKEDPIEAVILFDYMTWHNSEKMNIAKIDARGDIVWQSKINYSFKVEDLFVSLSYSKDKLFANTWGCNRYEVDIKTGYLEHKCFVK